MTQKTYELLDPASGKKSSLPLRSGTIGPDVVDIAALNKEHGVFTFDPGFMATASTESKVTYIDGDAGVLLYRGYPIDQLAAQSSFVEVAYLLLYGDLPNAKQLADFTVSIQRHTMINESLLRMFNGFHYDAHPMAMVSGIIASMSAFYHDSWTSIIRATARFLLIALLPKFRRFPLRHTSARSGSRLSIREMIWTTAAICCTCFMPFRVSLITSIRSHRRR